MKKLMTTLMLAVCTTSVNAGETVNTQQEKGNIKLVRQMFHEVSEELKVDKIKQYYSPRLEIISNNRHINYQQFTDTFKQVSDNARGQAAANSEVTLKKIVITRYENILAKGNQVAMRLTMSLTDVKDSTKAIEVMLIAHISQHKIDRIWEVTYPDWV